MQQKENFHWILRANLTKLSAFTFVYSFLGLYRSWKTWKVLEIFFDIFQDFPVLEKDYSSWNVLKICLTQAIKFSEFMPVMYLDHWENLV